MNTVIFRTWTEHERGWGNRPDGFSLHVSEKDMQDYINNYWASMPETVQDEYSAPDETFVKVIVSDEIFEMVKENKNIRSFEKFTLHQMLEVDLSRTKKIKLDEQRRTELLNNMSDEDKRILGL